ncbi:redoxin domain-containing protein [Cardiosporidium cionae]|uniref:Redoxin domain-containing protein n=1 Tax=Cardiosporidium cionae TaxID=476202 RepID=A0ABQ7J807_9APIC|nr:redoxin domain-containing protein [Cardiosporidium cionae]|eukprot:KAF8819820.1 redoxin domain-containing protein [Cardiosporidium cionae]
MPTRYSLLASSISSPRYQLSMISEGSKVPQCTWSVRIAADSNKEESSNFVWSKISVDDIFKGKRVILFGLPGAFTPTCSVHHLPGYEEMYDTIRQKGIDEIYCLSVNDPFVMNAWKKELGVKRVKFLPDGSGEFTNSLGLLVDKSNLGLGRRTWRYSMVINDGVVEKVFLEPGKCHNALDDPFEVSDAQSMLNYLERS